MRYLMIFFIYIKRRLRNPAFVAAALIIPLIIPLAGSVNVSDTSGFNAGFCCGNNERLSAALQAADGMVNFIPYDTTDDLIRDVENESLNCGYVLSESILTDITENKRGAITCFKAPSSMLTEVVDEAFFAELARLYSPDMAQSYLRDNGIAYDEGRLTEYYNNYLNEGKAISIEYSYVDGPEVYERENSAGLNSLSGLIAVYIMLGGILGINEWIKDEKASVPFGAVNVMASAVILSVCSAAALALMGSADIYIMAKLLLYTVFVIAYCTVIKYIFGKMSVICGLIPVLILGSLILCPVFMDITAFIPQLGCIRYLFAPFYFTADITTLAAGTAAVIMLSFAAKAIEILAV